MKRKLLFLAIIFALSLSACNGTPAEEIPELTGEDIQATAVAMAWTMAAETMAAMPTQTFTPLPPTATFTPAFTATPLFSPTPLFTATPEATATSEGEIKMLYDWDGTSTKLLFVNDTKATATISLYLNEGTNGKGYYGYIPVPVLTKNQSASVSAPVQGGYSVFAWMARDDRKWSVSGYFGTNNPDKHEIHLTENGIKVIGP